MTLKVPRVTFVEETSGKDWIPSVTACTQDHDLHQLQIRGVTREKILSALLSSDIGEMNVGRSPHHILVKVSEFNKPLVGAKKRKERRARVVSDHGAYSIVVKSRGDVLREFYDGFTIAPRRSHE